MGAFRIIRSRCLYEDSLYLLNEKLRSIGFDILRALAYLYCYCIRRPSRIGYLLFSAVFTGSGRRRGRTLDLFKNDIFSHACPYWFPRWNSSRIYVLYVGGRGGGRV